MTLGKLLCISDRAQVSKMRLNTSATTLSQKQYQLWAGKGISEINTLEISKVPYKIVQLLYKVVVLENVTFLSAYFG